MEIILAIVVASAVIFFGVLISFGNERQRKSIDVLREQVSLWAIQDIKIKREKHAHVIKIDKPLEWLSQVISKATGENIEIDTFEKFDDPQSLVCTTKMTERTVILCTHSLSEILQHKQVRKNKLSPTGMASPLFSLPKNAIAVQLSPLNSGMFFDIELSIVWKLLSGFKIHNLETIWVYIY